MSKLTDAFFQAQLDELLRNYPKMHVTESTDKHVVLAGRIHVNREAEGFTLNGWYDLEIHIPMNLNDLPVVSECGGKVLKNYPHRNGSGTLCLEAAPVIYQFFENGHTISEWMDQFVESYFFTYEYYQRFGTYPFGERSHGFVGAYEAYCELFGTEDKYSILKLLNFAVNKKYRGHHRCPCGNGERLRNCHGKILMQIMNDESHLKFIEQFIPVRN